jgi:hypothetical protein
MRVRRYLAMLCYATMNVRHKGWRNPSSWRLRSMVWVDEFLVMCAVAMSVCRVMVSEYLAVENEFRLGLISGTCELF